MKSHILILGVGNILLKDEGFGVHAVNHLSQHYSFSENVKILDGGTLGIRLLSNIQESDYLIVIDVMSEGNPPGTIKKLSGDELLSRISLKSSLHQVTFSETLALARLEGYLPETVVYAVEAVDMNPWGTELTPIIASKINPVTSMVLEEIKSAGGTYAQKKSF
jgi:hydrogenase maturation protease